MNTARLKKFVSSFSVIVRPKDVQQDVESKAIYYAALCFIVTGVIASVLYYGHGVPIFGRASMGVVASLFGFVVAFSAYLLSSQWQRPLPKKGKRKFTGRLVHIFFTTASLALVFAFVALLGLAGLFYLLQDAFAGLAFDSWSAAALTATAVAAAGYVSFLGSAQMNSSRLSTLLAIFLVTGVLTSMITAENPYWWQYHFSYLGGGDSFSSKAFNMSLILGGGAIAALSDYIANDFANLKVRTKASRATRVNLIRTLLIAIGVCLAFVGIFAWDTSTWIHNTSAGLMAIFYIALVVSLPRIAPVFSPAFFQLSFIMVAALVVGYILFNRIGYLNLTAFELLAASIVFTWIVLFIRQIGALAVPNKKY